MWSVNLNAVQEKELHVIKYSLNDLEDVEHLLQDEVISSIQQRIKSKLNADLSFEGSFVTKVLRRERDFPPLYL
jgi:hypothetical protein